MSNPTIQSFFETPIIEAELVDPGVDTAVEAAKFMADRVTVDVRRPNAGPPAWHADSKEMTIGAGETGDWTVAPGALWIAYICRQTGGEGASLAIEDPRALMTQAGPRGLAVGSASIVETIKISAGRLTMFPGYLRHRVGEPSNWIVVSLRPREP